MTISSVHLTYRPITSLTSTLNCTTSSLARKGLPGCCESSIKYRPLQGYPDQMQDFGIQENFAFKIRSLGLEIQNSGKKTRNPFWGWNLESNFHWPRILNLVLEWGIQNPWRGIQNPSLSWITLHGAIKGFREVDHKTYSNCTFILVLTKLISRGSKSATKRVVSKRLMTVYAARALSIHSRIITGWSFPSEPVYSWVADGDYRQGISIL